MIDRICSVDGCVRKHYARGWCNAHWTRWNRTGDPSGHRPIADRNPDRGCAVPGCDRPFNAGEWCRLHYNRWRKTGEVGQAEPERVWYREGTWIGDNGYEKRRVNGRQVYEHRRVMEETLSRPLRDFESVHHINGIRHDNRPENLELWVKPQVPGQRASDLAEWVVEHYPELVEAALADRKQLRLVI